MPCLLPEIPKKYHILGQMGNLVPYLWAKITQFDISGSTVKDCF